MAVAFGGSVLGSAILAFHPVPPKYSNPRLAGGILAESTALVLFLTLLRRQGRSPRDIGLSFRWTDLPKGLGLVLGSFVTMAVVQALIDRAWLSVTQHTAQWTEHRTMFAGSSLLLILPFLLLNPFFEEILVRGYLTTELIDLKKSVLLATLVSLGLQTSYHLYYGVFGAIVVGSGLSILATYYALSRRLMPVILAHLLWDATALMYIWRH
ncbi:MAG TPA: CPBP family intramembrane glutamic endopeptidase [Candidatus Angelobacter sp.]|nr:CPBP family intramembrane glutamic endopeptidase [Candidatus Angelobacter sp.]